MKKKKFQLVIDNCLYDVDLYPSIHNFANALTLEDLGLPMSATDERILAAAQKEERIVWTSDAGSGFSRKTIFDPKLNKTGVIITLDRYDEGEQEESLHKLWYEVDFEDLKQKRTKVSLRGATISSADEDVEIEFK